MEDVVQPRADAERLRLLRTNRAVRSAAFAYCLFPIGLYLWQRDAAWLAWALLVLQFVVYPQLAYWRAVRSSRPVRAELDNLFLDAALLGAWVAYLGFPLWITYGLIGAAVLNAAVNRGPQGAVLALACASGGAALWTALAGTRFMPETGPLVTVLAAVGSMGYTCAVAFVVWRQNRRLVATRNALRASEERYRLIAEHADDLVAMVDATGRWLYTSPSYERVLEPQDLGPEADLFRRIHPDDAEAARVAIARAAASDKPRELGLRLVDREGRVRQYRCRVHPVHDAKAPRPVVLVSQDITDLRETEERALLAGHALEGMNEAIMITLADGTVVTVNRAFSEITGRSSEEVLGQPEKSIRGGLQPPEFYDAAYATLEREGYWTGTVWARRKSGAIYREWRTVRAVKDPTGVITHYVHVFYEVGAPRAAAGGS